MPVSRAGPRASRIASLALTYPGYSLHRLTLPLSTWALEQRSQVNPPRESDGPRVVTLEITDRCNLRCKMCWFWGEAGQGDAFRGREMSDEALERLVEELGEWKPWLVITGGEPMLRPKAVLRIARRAKARGMPVSLINNGTVDGAGVLADSVAPEITSVTFSIDGPPPIHDFIRGKGAFERTRSAVQRLLDSRGRSSTPLVGMNFTITPWNHQHATQMIRIAEDLGLDRLTFQHLWFTSPIQANDQAKLLKDRLGVDLKTIRGHVISHDFTDVESLVSTMESVRDAASRSTVQVLTYPRFSSTEVRRYYTESGFTPRSRCLSPWLSTVVKPSGDVVFCPDQWITEYTLGNVQSTPFSNIWHSERASRFRSELWAARLFPACNRCCSLYGY